MITTPAKHEISGYVFILLAALCFGTLGVFGRMIYQYESNPLTVVVFRAGLAAILLGGSLLIFRRDLLKITTRDIPFFALYGFLSVSCNYLTYFYAIKYTSIATATVLLFTSPALVCLFSTILLGEVLTRQKLVSLSLTFLGALLVIQCYHPALFKLNFKGIVFGFGTSISVTIYTLFGKKAITRYDSRTVVFYSMSFGALFLSVFQDPRILLQVAYPLRAWGWIFLVALIPTVLSYSLYTRSFHYLEASKASIISSIEVVTTPLIAYIFLGESLTGLQILGAGLVVWGIILLQTKQAGVNEYERTPAKSVY